MVASLAVGVGAMGCAGATSGRRFSKGEAVVTITSGASVVEKSGAVPIGDYDGDDYSPGRYKEADNDDSGAPKDRDNDSDNKSGSYYDSDDAPVRELGRPAGTAERRAVTTRVEEYFAAAATENGAVGCSLILPSLARAVPQNVGQPPGPPYYRGTTCAMVLTKVFKRNHRQMAAYAAQLTVTGVRLSRESSVAVLGFRSLPGRYIPVERKSGRWWIDALLDDELP